MLSPEERARQIMHETRYLPVNKNYEPDYRAIETAITAAIREAVEQERERAAQVVDECAAEYPTAAPFAGNSSVRFALTRAAARIRAPS